MQWALTDFEKISAAHGMCDDENEVKIWSMFQQKMHPTPLALTARR